METAGTEQRAGRKQQRKALLVISARGLILISGVAVALYFPKPLSPRDPLVREYLGGPAKARVIASAHTIKAWRTLGSFRNEETLTGERFWELYQKAGAPVAVPRPLAAQLKRILFDPQSYLDPDPPRDKASITMPCVVVSFADGRAEVDVFISFADNRLQVKKDQPAQSESREMAHGDFDPVRKEFIEIVKQIFPADQQIQALPVTNWGGTLWPETTR